MSDDTVEQPLTPLTPLTPDDLADIRNTFDDKEHHDAMWWLANHFADDPTELQPMVRAWLDLAWKLNEVEKEILAVLKEHDVNG
jgi:hypothetical protein